MELISEVAQAYAERFSSPEDNALRQINEATYRLHEQPHMLSGHLQGKFLQAVSAMLQPRRILEIGTFTGYSAICLCKGLAADGKVHTIELRAEDVALSQQNFILAGVQDKVISHHGNAADIIPFLEEVWDMVFIDADKPNYSNYYRMVLPRVRKGGVILADNVFFHGQVLEPEIKGKNALAIQAFNEMVQQDESVDKVLLTIRDGLLLIIKK